MKNLERAVRVYCALCESPIRVSSAGARDWPTVQAAIQHDGGLLMEMESLKEPVRERVLAYVCELSPLNEHAGWPTYLFADEKAAGFFVNEVTRAGGHTSFVDGGTMVAADMDGMDEMVATAAATYGGVKYTGPNLQEAFERVDTKLPEALMQSGLDPKAVEEALINSIYSASDPTASRTLNESLWIGMDSSAPIERFRGRLQQFCKPKPVLGVPAHIAEAVRVSGMAPAHIMSLLEVGAGGQPGVAGNTNAQQQDPNERGGIAKDQPNPAGQPAGDQNGTQEQAPAPTEHVPSQEQGGTGDITLSNGMVVPQEVIAQAMGKMLQNLATQVQQGVPQNGVPKKGPGTQPPAVQAVQQQGQSQAEVGAQADPAPAGENSAQPEGSQPEQPQGAAQEAPAAEAPAEPQQDPNAQQAAPETPQQGQENGEQAQPNPEVDQLMQAAEQGDQEALKKVQGMQGEMTDEQKQKLQAILQAQNGGGAPAPGQPQQESLDEGMSGSLRILAKDWNGEHQGPGRFTYRFDYETDADGFERDVNMEYPRARTKVTKVGGRDGDYMVRVQESTKPRAVAILDESIDEVVPAIAAVGRMAAKGVAGAAKAVAKNPTVKKAAKKAGQAVIAKAGTTLAKRAVTNAFGGEKKKDEAVLNEMRAKRDANGRAAVMAVKNFLRFARGQMEEAGQSDGDPKSRTNAKNLARQLDPIISKVGGLRPPMGITMEIYVNPNPPIDMWGKASDDGGDLLRAASRTVSDAGNMLSQLGWKVEAAADTKTAKPYFALAATVLHGRLGDSIDRAADRWAFGLGEGQRGKPQHGTSDSKRRKATGKTSSDRDMKGKARHSRPQAGGGRKYGGGGSSSDYGHKKSQRKEPVMETVYGMVHEGRGTSVWEPLGEDATPGAILPSGVDFGHGECAPGTPVMVLERGEETSLIFTPDGHRLRCANEHLEDGDFYVLESGEAVEASSLASLIESAGVKDVVLVVGTPASGKSHYLRTALGPALREAILPTTFDGLVSEACVVEAAEVIQAWQRALNEDANVDESEANEAIDAAIGRAAHRLFYDRTNEALVQIGETLVIDCASRDPRVTDFNEILESCGGIDVLLADFRTPLKVAQERNEMRMVEDATSRSDLVRQHNATRRLVNELWADPRVTHRASYEWISEDALDGEYFTEGAQEKAPGPREKRQIGQRTTYDIDGEDPKDPKMRKQIVTMESLTEGYVPVDEEDVEEGSQSWKKLFGKAKADRKAGADAPSKSNLARMDHKQSKANFPPNPYRDDDRNKRARAHKARRGKKTKGKMEGYELELEEQLDVGQAAEGESTAKAMQEAGIELKKAREAIFKLTTASMVQVSSMAKAAGMKRTASASEAAMTAASGLLDDLQKVGQLLDKTNEVMKGENNGQGGDTVDTMNGNGAAPVNTGPGQDVVVQAGNGDATPPAPVPTPESVEADAISLLLETEVIDMIREGAHHRELSEALMAHCPELDARQRARVIGKLESVVRVPVGADIQLSMGPRDLEALTEAATHGTPVSALLERLGGNGQTLATRHELEETVTALEKHGGVRQLLLAKVLGADTSGVSN